MSYARVRSARAREAVVSVISLVLMDIVRTFSVLAIAPLDATHLIHASGWLYFSGLIVRTEHGRSRTTRSAVLPRNM